MSNTRTTGLMMDERSSTDMDRNVRHFPITRCVIPTPSAMLREHLSSEPVNGESLRFLLDSRPDLRKIVHRLASYLTHLLLAVDIGGFMEQRTLFSRCLDIAISEWQFAQDHGATTHECNGYFIRGLVAPLSQVLIHTVRVRDENGDWVWDPTQERLATWIRKMNRYPIVGIEPSNNYWGELYPGHFRMIVLSRFLLREPATLRMVVPYLDRIVGS